MINQTRDKILDLLSTDLERVRQFNEAGERMTVHIQLAAGATGYAAIELYRGLTTDHVHPSWGLTIPAVARINGRFLFLVARDGGKVEDGWTYDVYTSTHTYAANTHHKVALTGDGDRLVKLIYLESLANLGSVVLNLPGYTPRS